uniref:Protein TIC 214 n=1 Tax=Primula ranunculoides TaxID=931088 RepID=A0A7T3PCC0_9ERIC|nr:hypothetical chloroplast RF1 [Primula ranunculoides]QPZ50880.1 hypothetical chloroplast RF1 [Primula ranunculoides]
MIFKSFLLGNLVSLCLKIINSVVVVGLYYGFLTTFSIGPSYLFLLRAQVMEEGTEKKVSATTGFITGQLMMFISIYYAPMHLALGRPHTITVLALPYLLFHFFWNNHKNFFDYESTTRNSMRNLSIQCVFLNNLIFQIFNHFILPSSMLARLVNIYMFRCNNKMLFVTSSFVGWLIGHILFMKWLGLVLVWIRQNRSIRSNVLIRSNKYLVSELRNSMARIFSILLFITCVYYLGRIPSPILTKKLQETSKTEERDVEIETTYETKRTKQEQEGSTEEDTSPSLFSEEKEGADKIDQTKEIRVNRKEKKKFLKKTYYKYKKRPIYEASYLDLDKNEEKSKLKIFEKKKFFWFEKPFVTLLFDYNRWNRPMRYIKNNKVENTIRNEMSQYFFSTCQSYGKKKISFSFPPSLSTFWKIIQRKRPLFKIKKDKLYKYWVYTNQEKKNNLTNELINRMETLDKGFFFIDILEKKIRLCNEENLRQIYDPFLNRRRINLFFSPLIINEIVTESFPEKNKIHTIFLTDTHLQKFEQKMAKFEKKTLSKKMSYFLTLINQLARDRESNFNLKKSFLFSEQERVEFEKETNFFKFLFNAIITDTNNKKRKKNIVGIKEISKNVPRWSYKLITEFEQEEGEGEDEAALDHEIRSRKFKQVVIFSDNSENSDTINKDTNNPDQTDEVALIRYSQQSDFQRDIIKGSMRAQRRKTIIWELFQANAHSLLFLNRNRIGKAGLFFFDTSGLMKLIFRNWMREGAELKISDYTEEERKEEKKNEKDKKEENKRKENERIEIAEAWDTIPFAQVIRGLMLITQSTLRKYIILPSLIIAKNIVRMVLFQFPEWSEDLKEWNREIHIKCTYNGVQLSESEFPRNWLLDGIQIKVLFPFCLKPWHGYKLRYSYLDRIKKKGQKDSFCFLTVWGMETEFPFGSPRKRPSFFDPILKKLEKKLGNLKKRIKEILKINKILLIFSRLKEVDKSKETKKEKHFITDNQIINESMDQIKSRNWTNFLLTEKKMNDLTDRTNIIRKKIERITKEKKKVTSEINVSTNKKNCNAKRFELTKIIWQILKRRSARIIRKFSFFIKFFIENIYIDILLSIINIPKIHSKLCLESIKTIIEKPISNTKKNHEKSNKTNQNTINFISTIQKSFYNISKNNLQNFDKLSSFSQAYIFYKLSKVQAPNFFNILEYRGTSFFLKTSINKNFGNQEIIDSQFKDKKLMNSKKNQWKGWLRGYYQYNLSQIKWSKLIAQKWRNSTKKCRTIRDKNLNKADSYEKEKLSYYKKPSDYKVYLLPNQKDNFQKYYTYNLLSYRSINYEKREDPSIYRSPFQVNKTQKNFYIYNIQKINEFAKLAYIPININNFLGKSASIYMEKNMDRKNFDWKIINFCLKKKIDIEAWVKVTTNRNQNTKTEAPNYQIMDKIDKKDIFYLMIHQDEEKNASNKKKKWDWMGMNTEILSHPISNLELWFFPEFFLFYNAYKIKSWFIPSKCLFLNLNINENLSETKNLNRKQKGIILSNEKKYFEFTNKKEKEFANQRDLRSTMQNQESLVSVLLNQENEIAETYLESDRKKLQKKKQYKSNTEAELDFFLKRYFLFQLRWGGALNQRMINNIKIYCLLLRLRNLKKIALSSIQRREMNLDIMLIKKNLTLTELMKRGRFIIEPLRLSVKKSGQFLMHQTINISLVHKSRHGINQRYQEKIYANKEDFDKSIRSHLTGSKNSYLFFPENILASRRRRELRILICFHSKNSKDIQKNRIFCNGNNFKSYNQFLNENNDLDRQKLIKLKLLLWPNYRLEDLACMNRYWFDTNNGSSFSLLRIRMYPEIEK